MRSKLSEYKGGMLSDRPIDLTITDSRGFDQTRSVVPQRIWFGHTARYKVEQWLFEAYDVSLDRIRVFPLTDLDFGHTWHRVPHGSGHPQSDPGVPVPS